MLWNLKSTSMCRLRQLNQSDYVWLDQGGSYILIKFNRFIPVSMEFFCLKLSEHSKQNKVVSLKEAIATHEQADISSGWSLHPVLVNTRQIFHVYLFVSFTLFVLLCKTSQCKWGPFANALTKITLYCLFCLCAEPKLITNLVPFKTALHKAHHQPTKTSHSLFY